MGSRKVRQHVTKQSVVLLVFIVGLFFEAYMHNFNLVYIALFFLLGLAMAAIPVGILNIGKLRPHWEGCGRLFANEEGACRVRIDNPSSTPAWGIDLVCGDKSVKRLPYRPVTVWKRRSPFGRNAADARDRAPVVWSRSFPWRRSVSSFRSPGSGR